MEQSVIITCFDEEIIQKEKEKYKYAEPLVTCKDDIQSVINDVHNLKKVDLYGLQSSLALSSDVIEELEAYIFFDNSKYYSLTEEQQQRITKMFTGFLKDILRDINQIVNAHPDTAIMDEMIYTLKECRGILIREDFDLDQYTEIFVKMRPYQKECRKLFSVLAKYMNDLLLKKNNFDGLSYYHRPSENSWRK